MYNACRVTVTTLNGVRLAAVTVAVECDEVQSQNPRLNRFADTVLNRLVQRHGVRAYYFHNRYSSTACPPDALVDPQAIDRALPPASPAAP